MENNINNEFCITGIWIGAIGMCKGEENGASGAIEKVKERYNQGFMFQENYDRLMTFSIERTGFSEDESKLIVEFREWLKAQEATESKIYENVHCI